MKTGQVLVDTGPLVSFLAAGLRHHTWACQQWKSIRPPMLTCEPVLTEAAFLLKREGHEADPIFELLARGVIRVALDLQAELEDIRTLMASLSQPANVTGGCLPSPAFGTPCECRGIHVGLGLPNLPPPRQQSDPRFDS